MKNYKKLVIGLAAALSLTSFTACSTGDVSVSDKPEVIACRAIDAVVSNDEEEYTAVYPDSVDSMYSNYEYLHNQYGLRCRKFGIDYETAHSYIDTELCEYSNNDINGRISYYAYLEGESMLHIVIVFDTAKNGYVIEKVSAVKPEHKNNPSEYFKKNGYKFVDTESVDID